VHSDPYADYTDLHALLRKGGKREVIAKVYYQYEG
jgi:hypothetical protein